MLPREMCIRIPLTSFLECDPEHVIEPRNRGMPAFIRSASHGVRYKSEAVNNEHLNVVHLVLIPAGTTPPSGIPPTN